MRKLFFIAVSVLTLNSVSAQGNAPKIIYGDDNRQDAYSVKNPLYLKLAKSTAVQVGLRNVSINLNLQVVLNGGYLTEEMNLCATEPFTDQLSVGRCSGFLVGEDILVTAGHCAQTQAECENNAWVFDYKITDPSDLDINTKVDPRNVYLCKKLVGQALDEETKMDYAVIKLDRKVVGRSPLKIRREGKLKKGEKLVVIGYPSGLPMKIADGAKVKRTNNPVYFKTNLDTYGGNSGSAVFNVKTGVVEGILVRGGKDYVYDAKLGCAVSNKCTNSLLFSDTLIGKITGCTGEEVTRITAVPGI